MSALLVTDAVVLVPNSALSCVVPALLLTDSAPFLVPDLPLVNLSSPLSRIWGRWGSYCNIPKAILYLLKGTMFITSPKPKARLSVGEWIVPDRGFCDP